MRVLAALLFVLPALAGCSAIGADDGVALLSALEARAAADGRARSWSQDAALVNVFGLEAGESARREMDGEIAQARQEMQDNEDEEGFESFRRMLALFQAVADTPDPSPGDGRGPVWVFSYAGSEGFYAVGVVGGKVRFADGGEEAADEFAFGTADGSMADWRIDSDDAAAAAAVDGDYQALVQDPSAFVAHTLDASDGVPVWVLEVETEEDDVEVAVDAVSGSLVQDQVVQEVQPVFQEAGSMGGSVTGGVGVQAGHSFEVTNPGHGLMAFDLVVFPSPAQPVDVTVTDPNGVTHGFQVPTAATSGNPFGAFGAEGSLVISEVPEGGWSVAIVFPVSVRDSYQFSFCTDGEASFGEDDDEGPDSVRACDHLEGDADDDGRTRGETLSPLVGWLVAWQP